MSFGFADDSEVEEVKKEMKYSFLDTLKWQKWESLHVGQEVQSVLTEVFGKISKIDTHYRIIEIDWNNGNHTKASKDLLEKVILVPVV